MTKLMQLRLGVSHDPDPLPPTLADCIEAVLRHSEVLMRGVIDGLEGVVLLPGPRRSAALQLPAIRAAAEHLVAQAPAVAAHFRGALTHEVYHGGGKDDNGGETLRFEDLKLFADDQLDQSIEVARAQQEVSLAVDDVLGRFDALISTLLGWRTIQPGLNPLRPEVFVRALQNCLATHVADSSVRDSLIAPAAGLLGVNLRRIYREITDWLQSSGIEAAAPVSGRVHTGPPGTAAPVDAVSRTLLTLDRLRKLLAGDLHPAAAPRRDFQHTVPASLVALQDLKQVDVLFKRLEQRPRDGAVAPPPPADSVFEGLPAEADDPAADAQPRLGHQLGTEVVRLMFDNLEQDARLLPPLKRRLRRMRHAITRLAREDSRFFSDRTHPARQLLDVITQRSLAFPSETDEGWNRFKVTVDEAIKWLSGKVVDADVVGELLDHLQATWDRQDAIASARAADAERALAHAEQRNLLAQATAAEFAEATEGLEIADFVRDFLRGSWSQVVAEAQLTQVGGEPDPFGYRALVDDLVWSVQKKTAVRTRTARLVQMIPDLVSKLRDGLARIDYPPDLTQRFFDGLGALHAAALQQGRDDAAQAAAQAAADAAEAQPSQFTDSAAGAVDPWLAGHEAQESGYLDGDSVMPADLAVPVGTPAADPAAITAAGLAVDAWIELIVDGRWLRMKLTWASPHATLFMFTSIKGTAHSMSRRTLERLRAQGLIRVVAGRHVVDEALDQVARAALKNSLGEGG